MAALQLENERLKQELAATAGKRLAVERVVARAEERRSAEAEVAVVNARQVARQAAESERERVRAAAEDARLKAAVQRAAAQEEAQRRDGGKAGREQSEAAEGERERRRAAAEGARLKAAMQRAAEPGEAKRGRGKAARKAAQAAEAVGTVCNQSKPEAEAHVEAEAEAEAEAAATAVAGNQADEGGEALVGREGVPSGGYATLAGEARHEEVVVKSRFLAYAAPVADAEQAIAPSPSP